MFRIDNLLIHKLQGYCKTVVPFSFSEPEIYQTSIFNLLSAVLFNPVLPGVVSKLRFKDIHLQVGFEHLRTPGLGTLRRSSVEPQVSKNKQCNRREVSPSVVTAFCAPRMANPTVPLAPLYQLSQVCNVA